MRVMNIVLNSVRDDGRVLKTARSGKTILGEAMILGFSRTKEMEEFVVDGVTVVLIPHPQRSLKAEGKWSADPNSRDMDEFINRSAELIKPYVVDFAPDILHTHDMFGLGVGAMLIRKLLTSKVSPRWLHDCHEYTLGASNIPQGLHSYAVKQHEQFIREPDKLTTVSDGIADYLIENDTLSERPEVILNVPVASPTLDPDISDIRSAIGVPLDQDLIVYSGSIASPQRGVATLIEAMRHMEGVHVAITTNRPKSFEELRDLAKNLGVDSRLHMHDYVPVDQIARFLRTADLGCHPIRRYPNSEVALPNKLFDYLHADLPVVVSDVETMSQFVRRHNVGEVFTSGDAVDLAEKCKCVLRDNTSYRESITADFKAEFSWEAQHKKIEKIYRDLLENSKQRQSNGEYRVFHGLTSASGQPWATVSGLRKLGVRADAVRAIPEKTPLDVRAHRVLSKIEGDQGLLAFSRFAPDYDIFHFYARSFIPGRNSLRFPAGSDLISLRAAGKKTLFNFRGSEARIPSIFREKSPYHWLSPEPSQEEREAEERQKLYLEFVKKVTNAVTVIDRELLTYVPNAKIVPRAIDLSEWKIEAGSKNSRPLIVHAPTNRDIKGTERIIEALTNLQRKGEVFDYEIIENTSNALAKESYESADIIIDQLRIGWYGVLAVEGMALGKPVMSYIRDDLVGDFEKPPLFPTRMETLEDDIALLLNSPSLRKELGQSGRAYVEMVHDYRRVAKLYKEIYEEILDDNSPLDIDTCVSLLNQQMAPIKPRPKKNAAKSDIAAVKTEDKNSIKPKKKKKRKPFLKRKADQIRRIASKFSNVR
ncbi:glycosyltransferase family 4 protein [Ruegeria arenilitoris]|uniref:glycosyltransferase family 4 protein n=1 Tax=Ruegeria arenilitoris TaxID=1173585 RepID=UPI001481569A|nr:glycosyltransferase [Ruegeria arenilitoris]